MSALHTFDKQLGWHVGHVLHRILQSGEYLCLRKLLDPAIMAFAEATAGSGYYLSGEDLVLSNFDLEHIAWAAAVALADPPWTAYPQTLQLWRDAVPDIQRVLGDSAARTWWELSLEAEGRILSETRFPAAVDVICCWTEEIRALLRCLGRADLVPAPDGGFGTPRCPNPIWSEQRNCTLSHGFESENHFSPASGGTSVDCANATALLAAERIQSRPAEQAEASSSGSSFPEEISTSAAAKILGCDKKTVIKLIEDGALEWRNAAAPSSTRPIYRILKKSILEMRTGYQRTGHTRAIDAAKESRQRPRNSAYRPKHIRRRP